MTSPGILNSALAVLSRLVCRLRGHQWRIGDTGPLTGYAEHCARCGAVQQVPQ